MQSRRDFLKQSPALGGALWLDRTSHDKADLSQAGRYISFNDPETLAPARPLQTIEVTFTESGKLSVLDGLGRLYAEEDVETSFAFTAGGALGRHILLLKDQRDRLIDTASFVLDTTTSIEDAQGTYSSLLDVLYWTMVKGGATDSMRIGGRFYHYFVRWLRDHVHTLKGMKYFHPELRSGIDLYADFQREDGMVWDNVSERNKEKNWWDKRFRYGDFIRDYDNGTVELKRIPVEADVEYLFIEGLYYTWKATGDNTWMASRLDAALRAIDYCLTNPYRWSEAHQLIKRGFTIDTWDYQAEEDAARVGGDIMVIDLEKTHFGVMFGDNTGFAASCLMLAEMLNRADRPDDADRVAEISSQIMQRTMDMCWNGEFFRHHVPEDANVTRDLGVDQDMQVSLSNAYTLNRLIGQDEAAAIIRSYQRIREEMPETSPGEWYTIYPPFRDGFDGPSPPWEYMNGGVSSIVAGEVARGAFERGFEQYGVDILERIGALAMESDWFLPCVYRGKRASAPDREFELLNLASLCNAEFPDEEATFEGERLIDGASEGDIRIRELCGIPFEIIDPEVNNSRSAIEIWNSRGHLDRLALPISGTTESIYLLHTSQGALTGTVTLHYDNDDTHVEYIDQTKYGNWWHEPEPVSKTREICQKGWRSDSESYVGLYVFGFDNPRPLRTIRAITLEGAEQTRYPWRIVAISLCNAPMFLSPGPVSYGIPHNWGAAAVTSALIEGLAGIKDTGVAFDHALLAPRWAAANESEAKATAKYEASGGYLTYEYSRQTDPALLKIRFTGSMERTRVECLIPADFEPDELRLNGRSERFEVKEVESSRYVCVDVEGVGAWEVEIEGRR